MEDSEQFQRITLLIVSLSDQQMIFVGFLNNVLTMYNWADNRQIWPLLCFVEMVSFHLLSLLVRHHPLWLAT